MSVKQTSMTRILVSSLGALEIADCPFQSFTNKRGAGQKANYRNPDAEADSKRLVSGWITNH